MATISCSHNNEVQQRSSMKKRTAVKVHFKFNIDATSGVEIEPCEGCSVRDVVRAFRDEGENAMLSVGENDNGFPILKLTTGGRMGCGGPSNPIETVAVAAIDATMIQWHDVTVMHGARSLNL